MTHAEGDGPPARGTVHREGHPVACGERLVQGSGGPCPPDFAMMDESLAFPERSPLVDANSRSILGLIAEMNTRFVVPVYQRPYSWDEQQCLQLWDDVLSCGRRRESPHFTGSIVTVRDGTMSSQGVTPLLLIDGQQRITTITLLLIALARLVGEGGRRQLPLTREEIVDGGYLTNHFRTGDDHYKLTLSKDDRRTLRSLVDQLEDPSCEVVPGSGRLLENLAFFERRMRALDDVDSVWAGLQRLEVVSISLSQGQDKPQAIFESMNSTGKDLSSADLIRNFVLMAYPVEEQRDMYQTYWRPIEETLGTDAHGRTFDDFIRGYLTVAHAPESMARADVYQAFKRHVLFNGYHRNDRMKNLSLRIRRFASYYARTTTGEADDPDVARALLRLALLDMPVANSLLLALYDSYDHQDLSRSEFLQMIATVESYLLRRAVCDCETSVLAPFVASLIARLSAVRGEGGDAFEALCAMLLNEAGTPRRFPTDAEFARALRTRDCFGFSRAFHLLARLEERMGGAAPHRADWTIEHVMPVHALGSDAWPELVGEGAERAFEETVNSLGNLTLTTAAFDLQEGTRAEKLARVRGPEGGALLAISRDVCAADAWGPEQIRARTESLTGIALGLWGFPDLPEEKCRAYRPSRRAEAGAQASFADLFEAGLVEMDDLLVSANPLYPGRATVTSRGRIMLANGEMFDDPTEAYERFLTSQGALVSDLNGWMYWRRGEGGPLLDTLREEMP